MTSGRIKKLLAVIIVYGGMWCPHIRHTDGRDDALSGPRFAASYLSYRSRRNCGRAGLSPESRQSHLLRQLFTYWPAVLIYAGRIVAVARGSGFVKVLPDRAQAARHGSSRPRPNPQHCKGPQLAVDGISRC